MFRVGQKVICVNDEFLHRSWDYVDIKPRRGEVYTIHSIVKGWFLNHPNVLAFYLEEIINKPVKWAIKDISEAPFWSERFRPVIERETDIGFAHEILRKVTKRKPADAHTALVGTPNDG